MKIVYLLGDENISTDNGVVKKINLQTTEWMKMGHSVKIFSLRSTTMMSLLENATILSKHNSENNSLQNILQQMKNYKQLEKLLHSYKPDIIYMRYLKYYPGMIKILKNFSYIVEINSDEFEEARHGTLLRFSFNSLTRNMLFKNASGFVSVSKELMTKNHYKKFNKPYVVIGNGYSFESNIILKKTFNEHTKLVFIGSPGQIWHGIDKLIVLAELLPEFELHIVGPSYEELKNIKKDFPANIIAHGYLCQEKAEELIASCDIGISTLALHRKNMHEASPLKSRQYLAQGLPIIIGYEDTDLLTDSPFILNIGNYENNIIDHIEDIRNFIVRVQQMDGTFIRNKAKILLNYSTKEKIRISFLKKITKKEALV